MPGQTMSRSLRVLWVEQKHSSLEYYDALRHALVRRGVNITDATHSRDKAWLSAPLASAQPVDVVLLGFGWMSGEPPFAREIRSLPEFARNCAQPVANTSSAAEASRDAAAAIKSRPPTRPLRTVAAADPRCLCGTVPFFVLLNKEYALMPQKFRWLQEHCVDAAFSVHHDVARYEAASGVPFFRISFGADTARFSVGPPAQLLASPSVHAPAPTTSMSSLDSADILVRDILSRQRATATEAVAWVAPATTTATVPPEPHDPNAPAAVSAAAAAAAGREGRVASPAPMPHSYDYDLGFTGVVRKDQTSNWRYHIWKQSWPRVTTPAPELIPTST